MIAKESVNRARDSSSRLQSPNMMFCVRRLDLFGGGKLPDDEEKWHVALL